MITTSNRNHTPGFTMIELLIGIAILGISSSFIYAQITSMKRVVTRLQLKRQLVDLRAAVQSNTDCHQTLRPFIQTNGSIACNGAIVLKDSQGVDFTSSPINRFQLSATCSSATGISVLATSSVNAKDPVTKAPLDHTNTMLNPFLGRGSAYGLCENFFTTSKRVRVFEASTSELPYTSSECTTLKTMRVEESPQALSRAAYEQKINSWAPPHKLVITMDARCTSYCRESPRLYVGGYIADCNSTEVTCVCFR